MWNIYNFSPKAYIKANLFKLILVYSLLVVLFVFMFWLNGTLTLVSGLAVALLFLAFFSLGVLKITGIRSDCGLKICQDVILYNFVKLNGTSGDLMTHRYEEDIYCITKVDKYVIKSSKIIIYGIIEKDQKRVRNSYENTKTKVIKSVKIPMYFEHINDFIQKLKEFQN